MALRTGLSLDSSTRSEWTKLVGENKEKTTVRLSEPMTLTCGSGDDRQVEIVPEGTEVSLFCNMKGHYKQSSANRSRRTLGTFFLSDGRQISIIANWRIRVNNATQATRPRSEAHRAKVRGGSARTPRH